MKLLMMLSILLFTACGVDLRGPTGRPGTDGDNGTNGTNGVDGKDYTPPVVISLEGYHYLKNDGYIELLKDDQGRIIINGTQKLFSPNADGSLSLLPALGTGPYTVHYSKIRIDTTLTYTAAANNTGMTGARRTVVTFSLTSRNKLVINVTGYSTTGLVAEYIRTIEEE